MKHGKIAGIFIVLCAVCLLGVVSPADSAVIGSAYAASSSCDVEKLVVTSENYSTREVSFTVYTGVNAKNLVLSIWDTSVYDIKKVYTWTDYAKYSTVVDGLRVWNVKYTFDESVETVYFNGYNPSNGSYGYWDRHAYIFVWPDNDYVNVYENDPDYGTGEIRFFVGAGLLADEIWMYDDSGELLKKWTKSNVDFYDIWEGEGVWEFSYTFEDTSRRDLTFVAYYKAAGAYAKGDPRTEEIFTRNAVAVREYDVKSAVFANGYAAKGKAAQVTVKTEKDARYLKMYSENGTLIKTWPASGNSTVTNGERVWNVSYAFGGTGERTMTFKASYNNSDLSDGVSANVLITSGASNFVNSAAFKKDVVPKGTPAEITVKTGADALYLKMYAENGSLIKTWKAADCSEIVGKQRVWNISYTFSGVGNRTMTFKGSIDNSTMGTPKSAGVLITSGSSYQVISAAFASDAVAKGTSVTATVKTGGDAKFLMMYSETGALIRTWKAADCSKIVGNERVWNISYTFSGVGSRTMTFKASPDKSTFGATKTATVLITNGSSWQVNSAAFASDMVEKGASVNVTVKTGGDAKFLRMYSETGAKVKTWSAAGNSKIVGTERVWTISVSISSAGSRELTFKASRDGETYGEGRSDSLLVTSGSDIAVISAVFGQSSAVKGNAVAITVKTGADAKYLRMYTEAGVKVKTWSASGSSVISGGCRVWTVSYTFGGAGDRSLTFKASKDGSTYGAGKTADIQITAE